MLAYAKILGNAPREDWVSLLVQRARLGGGAGTDRAVPGGPAAAFSAAASSGAAVNLAVAPHGLGDAGAASCCQDIGAGIQSQNGW